MERLSIPAGKFTKKASLLRDKKQAEKYDLQASAKEKKPSEQSSWGKPDEKGPFVKQKESLMKQEHSKLNLWTFCTEYINLLPVESMWLSWIAFLNFKAYFLKVRTLDF